MRKEHKGVIMKNFIQKQYGRVLISLCLIATVFVVPLLSEARYKAFLNGFAAVIAKEYYFSSNYLKEEDAAYMVNGWGGEDISIKDFQIRNYENTLLANQEGQDLNYVVNWTVRTFVWDSEKKNLVEVGEPAEGQPDMRYTLEASYNDPEQNPTRNTATYPEIEYQQVTGSLKHTIVGNGVSQKDSYLLTLKAPANYETFMDSGCYVLVTMSATNAGDDRNQYSRTITATMKYNVSLLENFIEGFEVTDTADHDDGLVVKIQTGAISNTSGATQKVYLWWDKSKLAANRYNPQFNQLFNENKYSEVTVGNVTYGRLEISATSSSSRTFEFTKADGVEDVQNYVFEGSYEKLPADQTYYMGYYVQEAGTAQEVNDAE